MSTSQETLLLAYGGFALSFAGLVVAIVIAGGKKKVVLWAGGVCLVVTVVAGLYQAIHYKWRVEAMSQEIVSALGRDTKTSDDIQLTLAKPDPSVFAEALDELVAAHEVGQEPLEVRDKINRRFYVRVYYAMTGKAGR